MEDEKQNKLIKEYEDYYTLRELFDEILIMQHGDQWDGISSQSHREETALMIQVFENRLKKLGIDFK